MASEDIAKTQNFQDMISRDRVAYLGHRSEPFHQFSASYQFCLGHYLKALDYSYKTTKTSLPYLCLITLAECKQWMCK